MLDSSFQPPSLHGLDLPNDTREAFIQLQEALVDALNEIKRLGNNPAYIRLDGGRTLREVMQKDRPKPGDLIQTVSKKASSLQRDGWVFCDGDNGTPYSVDAFVLGVSAADNPSIRTEGSGIVTSGAASIEDTEDDAEAPVWVMDVKPAVCGEPQEGEDVADHTHTHPHPHTHGVNIIGELTSFTVIWMMKL